MKVIISGAGGRMGRALIEVSKEFPQIEISGLLEKQGHPMIGKKVEGIEVKSSLREVIDSGDVLIEFTSPEASLEHLKIVKEKKKGMVLGTTGFNEEEKEVINQAGKEIPIVFSYNMSVGMNLFFHILGEVTRILGRDYEVEILEIHHHHKKDAPSGTALTLGEIIAANRGQKLKEVAVFGRKGKTGERKREEIGIHALRGGGVVGEHQILFLSQGERIEFVHRAESRLAFARGAMRAAIWLEGKKPGVYNMEDVLFK